MLQIPSQRRRRLALGTNIRWQQAGEDRHAARVRIGGLSRRFEPHTYSAKWGDEAWLTLLFPELTRDLQRPIFGGNLAELIAAGDRKHRWYVDVSGRLEYELVLGTLPASNILDFQIDFPAGLEFHYQPPLREERDARVIFATETEAYGAGSRLVKQRPASVVGSYAVYWQQSNQQYQTGKLCHIHRPELRDASGQRIFAKLQIDAVRKRLRIICPERWLAGATYPVTVDPTLGYTSLGASTDNTDEYFIATQFTAADNFNAATVYVGGSCDSGTQGVKAAGYAGGASTDFLPRLSNSVVATMTTTLGFRSTPITWNGIAISTNYWLALCHQDGGNTAYDSSTGTIAYKAATYSSEMLDPSGSQDGTIAGRISLYVEGSVPAAGLPHHLCLLGCGR